MKRLAVVLLLALVPCAFAQEKQEKKADPKQPVLPMNPLANAKVGDWSVFRCTIHEHGKPAEKPVLQSWKVVAVDEKEITVEQTHAAMEGVKKLVLPAKEAPTVALFCETEKEQVVELKTVDDKKTVAAREFACKKVTFATYNGENMIRATFWLSTDVKGSGVVAIRVEADLAEPKGAKASVDFEVAGFGSKDKTDFGATKAELEKELAAEKKPLQEPSEPKPTKPLGESAPR
jgi:hypothetical protein